MGRPSIAAVALCVAGSATCTRGAGPSALVTEIGRAHVPRTFAPALSVAQSFLQCRDSAGNEQLVAVSICDGDARSANVSARVVDIAQRAAARVRGADTQRMPRQLLDPDALHASALLDLIWGADQRNVLNRAVSSFATGAEIESPPVAQLVDLSAAYIVRAEHDQNPRDLVAAIDAAEKALELDPHNVQARFNTSLALERLHVERAAAASWTDLVSVDSTSPWSVEARRRARIARPIDSSVPPASAPPDVVRAFADGHPQAARGAAMDRWFAEWGAAVLSADSTHASELLRAIDIIGTALQSRGGDRTVADEVRAIREAATRARLVSIARAHVAYGNGQAAYASVKYAEALQLFERGASEPELPAPLRLWLDFGRGAAMLYVGDASTRDRMLRRVLASADSSRYSALFGRAHWILGTGALRAGEFQRAITECENARHHFERAGEDENAGAVQYLIADAELSLADYDAGYESMSRALAILARYPSSIWLHNALLILARSAEGDGMLHAARRLAHADIDVASNITPSIYAAEARVSLARLLASEHPDEAQEQLTAAARDLERVDVGFPRSWVAAHARYVGATLELSKRPAIAAAQLDTVIQFFDGRNAVRLLAALVARARALLSFGDRTRATADLERVASLLIREEAVVSREGYRDALSAAARDVFDRIVLEEVEAGRHAKALWYLEHARTALAPGASRIAGVDAISAPDTLRAVEYALIGDTLLTWTIANDSVDLRVRRVDRAALVRMISAARGALEVRASESTIRRELADVYDQLIRPIEAQLGAPGTPLVIVPDRELAAVPFAALFDTRHARYLIEDHSVRVAESLRDMTTGRAAAPRNAMQTRDQVVLVGNPARDVGASSLGMTPLPSAEREIRTLAREYDHPRMVLGGAADQTTTIAAFREATILHFAGHAVVDDRHPEQSYLVLASDDSTRAERLTANQLRSLDLRHMRLVVLAACETLSPNAARGGGYRGFASALRAAGARGIVGSLWRVEDNATSTLMVAFHHAYRASTDGAEALRSAQLRMLRGSSPAERSPASWAGFQYMGT